MFAKRNDKVGDDAVKKDVEPAAATTAEGSGAAAVAAPAAEAHSEEAPLGRKLSLALRTYGWIMTILAILNLAGSVLALAIVVLFFLAGANIAGVSMLSTGLTIFQLLLMGVITVCSLKLAGALRKLKRRKIAVWSRRLMWLSIIDVVTSYMLSGPNGALVVSMIQIAVLVLFSVRIDPTLQAEREAHREEEYEADMQAASQGMLGRDLSGKGFIRLDFFNLFWMFFICCILGLVLEIIWHMTVVDPGVYEDRAGLLIGPFSPIYGFGAVLITLALNRLYNKNPIITFVVSGIVGGGFEWLTAVFMKYSFGVTAWDYSDYTILGVPDPVAVISSGRTSTMFLVIWGVLGLVWVKFFLPIMLKGVNVIPWKLRYGLTAVVAAMMLANGLLTLGSLDCWFERASGVEPSTPIEQFYATYCNDKFMQNRFQSMTMNVDDATRLDTARKAEAEA